MEGAPGEPAKVKCPDTMVMNIISDKIKGKKAISFYRILQAEIYHMSPNSGQLHEAVQDLRELSQDDPQERQQHL